MDTLTEPPTEVEDFAHEQLPGRPRRKLLTRLTVPLLGLLLAAAGFLGGIEVEKSHTSGSSTGGLASSLGALRSRFASSGLGGAGGSTKRGFPGASGASGTSGGSRSGGFPGAAAAAGFAGGLGGGGTTGTISSISGRSIVLKTTSGNSITVTLTSATTLKKDLTVHRNSIRPGDTVTVAGITAGNGSMKASSISDAGASSSGSSSGSSSAGSSPSSSSSS